MNQWNDEWLASYQRRLRTAPHGQVTRARKEYVQAVADSMAQTPRKYLNTPIMVGDEKFDSKAEAERWQELQLLYRAGQITELLRQQRYVLEVEGKNICTYVADFAYRENGRWCVEDLKSPATAKNRAYRIKRKLFEALYKDIEFRETVAA